MGFGLELAKASAGQAASGIIGEGLGLLTQPFKNRQQLKQAGKLQELQIKGSKEMTDYNMSKQLQMWKDTSYGAQVEQMNKAGINPALMYGMGGGGGQIAGSGGSSVSGQSAGTAQKSSGGEGMGLMMGQMGLMEAQKKNIEADTKLKEADAAKKIGVDTENVKASTGLIRQQEEIAKVAASVSRQTIKEQMKNWENLISKQEEEIKQLGLSNKLDAEQLDDKVTLLKKEVSVEAMKTAVMSSEINRNNPPILSISLIPWVFQ